MTSVESEVARPFQRLSMAIPMDYNTYSVIVNFLLTVLNLNSAILNNNDNSVNINDDEFNFGNRQVELLPNIAFPRDTWLRDSIVIRDCKLKSSILLEILTWLAQEVENNADLDEVSLNHFEKLLIAYNIYDMPDRSSNGSIYSPRDVSMNEEDENDQETIANSHYSNSTKNHRNNSDNKSLQASSIYTRSSQHSQPKRMSSFSREIISSRKRLSSLLGHINSEGSVNAVMSASMTANISPPHSRPQSPVNSNNDNQIQATNLLLAKSKIYGKFTKRRESVSSTNSRNSVQTNSNRSSVQTNNLLLRNNSSSSLRKRTLALADTINESRQHTTLQLISTTDDKRENRRSKFEYYGELYKFLQITDVILKNLQMNQGDYNKSIRLLEFLQKKIFKFVVIDVCQMVLDYAALRAYGKENN